MKCRLWLLLAFAFATVPGSFSAAAQTYPTKPITFIVPFGAGGGGEANARSVIGDLSKALGQQIILDFRPGANGAIGSGVVAKAAPDGYTFLFTAQSTFSVNPNLMRELPYDQLKDFVPVASVGNSTWFLVVPKDSPFKSAKDVVDYARSNPDQVTGGFWQSSVLVTTIAFGKAAGIQIRRVPYKGAVESVTDVIANRLSLLFVDYNSIRGQVEAGNARVLASTSSQRSKLFGGNIPTLTELGYPVVTDTMTVIFAPTGTAKPIIERINTEMVKIVNTSAAQARIEQIGLDPAAMSLTELDNFVRSELPRWSKLIEDAGLQKQ